MRQTPEQWWEDPEWRDRPCPNPRCLARPGELCIDTRYTGHDRDGNIRIYYRFSKSTPHRERTHPHE